MSIVKKDILEIEWKEKCTNKLNNSRQKQFG